MDDMTDKAIAWTRQQKSLAPDKPFFTYFAPGATHAPHHVPKEWADQYAGQFDQGWDALREETFARQKELGVDPGRRRAHRAQRRHPRVGRDVATTIKPVLAREMEVYAGFLAVRRPPRRPADRRASRSSGILDDTLVYVIIGDNGASAEGNFDGTTNEGFTINHMNEHRGRGRTSSPTRTTSARPNSYNHYAIGWAHAMDTPYQWTKQVASHWGGTRNGTIVALAERHRGQGRDPQPVHPLHRRRADDPRGRRASPSRAPSTA